MRTIRCYWLMPLIIFILLSTSYRAQAAEPNIAALSAVLMDGRSGRILWAKEPHVQRPPASTTKIMTALIALESLDENQLNQPVRISSRVAQTPESVIWLQEGETLTLKDLLAAALIMSANDAAAAIAEQVGGSQEEFVARMNKRTEELGLKNTHYVNPHGLSEPNHYSTAYDLAVTARTALTLPKFQELVKTTYVSIPWAQNPWERNLYNTNRLLRTYPGADGVKTGYTREAGNCLVASATRNNQQLIAVVLNSPHKYDDVPLLFDYGFERFKPSKVITGGDSISAMPVRKGQQKEVQAIAASDLVLPLQADEVQQLQRHVVLPEVLNAPVKAGDKLGQLTLSLHGETIGQIDLIAAQEIKRQSIISWILGLIHRMWA